MESSTRLFAGSAGVPFETWEVGAVRLVDITETPALRRLLKELACFVEDFVQLQLESRKVEGNPGSSCSPARKESLP